MKAKELQNVSTIASGIGNVAGTFLGVPGLGSLVTLPIQPVINQMQETEELKSQFKLKYSPQQFKYGGELSGKDSLLQYKGRTHKEGGISVNDKGMPTDGNKEVEDGEVMYYNRATNKRYIFSNTI